MRKSRRSGPGQTERRLAQIQSESRVHGWNQKLPAQSTVHCPLSSNHVLYTSPKPLRHGRTQKGPDKMLLSDKLMRHSCENVSNGKGLKICDISMTMDKTFKIYHSSGRLNSQCRDEDLARLSCIKIFATL